MSHPVDSFFGALPPGWFSRNEAVALYDAVQQSQGDVLEIGTYAGRSATVILKALEAQPHRKLWCVNLPPPDNYCVPDGGRPNVAECLAQLRMAAGQRMTYFEGDIRAFRAAHPNLRFGLAFIDGNHDEEYVYTDAINCLQIVTGPLLFHDYGHQNGCPGVKRALDRLGLVPSRGADSMGILDRRPLISILTPVSRPENLAKVQASIDQVYGDGPLRHEWILIYDRRSVKGPHPYQGQDTTYKARAFSCDFDGQAGNCCRNVAIPSVTGQWIHHLDDDTLAHPGMAAVMGELATVPPEIQLYRFPIMIGDKRGTNYDTGSWLVRTPAPLWIPDLWGGDKKYVEAIPVERQMWSEIPAAHYNALRPR